MTAGTKIQRWTDLLASLLPHHYGGRFDAEGTEVLSPPNVRAAVARQEEMFHPAHRGEAGAAT